jgi:pimeloyl-ACP methyl ester carboxylesterase
MPMETLRIKTDGLTQQVLAAGPVDGPLVVLVHGFPELGISWRSQVKALGEAGYRALAPDMRGYGGTDRPDRREDYTILHLVGDMVDLVRSQGRDQAVVVGHDWGAPVAWHCALMRPDLFRAVAALSVPFQPRIPKGPPTLLMKALSKRLGLGEFYINQFQSADAHLEFEADVAGALRRGFYAYDGATPDDRRSTGFQPEGTTFLSAVPEDATLPPWMGEDHFAEYVAAFTASGLKGALDWYRCIDLNWTLTAAFQDRRIEVPAAFLVGDRDPVRVYAGQHEAGLKDRAPDLRNQVVLAGAGHWVQQERPDEVNAFLLGFLSRL